MNNAVKIIKEQDDQIERLKAEVEQLKAEVEILSQKREVEVNSRHMLVCTKALALQLLRYFSVDSLNDRGPIQELSEEYAELFPTEWQHPQEVTEQLVARVEEAKNYREPR